MTRPELSVTHTRDGDRLVVRLSGELELATKATLRTAIAGALTDQVRQIMVDASGLTFCDSTGVSTLVNLCRTADVAGRQLWVANLQPRVRRVLEITGMMTYLTRGPTQR